jgi:hypothetical protein
MFTESFTQVNNPLCDENAELETPNFFPWMEMFPELLTLQRNIHLLLEESRKIPKVMNAVGCM